MEGGRNKRQKTSPVETDPQANPYLAHMYDPNENSYSNGSGNKMNGSSNRSPLRGFVRHKTTVDQATKAENGPSNPFNGQPLSKQYFNILHTRRALPVHQQR